MFKNYLKIAFRNIIRHKTYSIINITGLAIGMACTILILLWVQDELSYDRFHQHADNVYLVLRADKEKWLECTSLLLGPALKSEFPEVINTTNYLQIPGPEKFLLQYGDKSYEENIGLTDEEFFNIFTFRFITGNPRTALKNPYSILLTEKAANKYFGNEEALGKTITLCVVGHKIPMKVTGIFSDMPHNSHLQSNILIPISFWKAISVNPDRWDNQAPRTYIMLKEKCNLGELSKKIIACEKRYNSNAHLEHLDYSLLPLTKIHLHGGNDFFALQTTGNAKYVYIFITIAVIILLIASINYVNLSTAIALKRTTEIGIKKVIGANRGTLVKQFLFETLIVVCIALNFTLIIVRLLLPVFNQLTCKQLTIHSLDFQFICGVLVIFIITGFVTGLYPAMFLSSFQPVKVLKGKLAINGKGLNMRKGMSVFQFSICIIMIICTLCVLNQMNFIQNYNLGYDKENILCLPLQGNIHKKYDVLKSELLKNANILEVSRSEPLTHYMSRISSVQWPCRNESEEKYFRLFNTDHEFASTYKVKMVLGRFFSEEFSTDKTNAFVINENAVKYIGLTSPLNQEIKVEGRKGKIIGVVKDFHFSSLHNTVEPLIIRIPRQKYAKNYFRLLSIRIKPGDIQKILHSIKRKWKALYPDIPFNFYFVDDALNTHYMAEQRMGTIFKYFSILAIFVACLGLFGLSTFTAEQKTKEIGIRKVLGGSVSSITLLLSKEYMKWVIIANVIAWPIAHFAMNNWLQSFAYRTELSWWIFILAGIIAFVIALATVSFQAIKAATRNPVEALRYE